MDYHGIPSFVGSLCPWSRFSAAGFLAIFPTKWQEIHGTLYGTPPFGKNISFPLKISSAGGGTWSRCHIPSSISGWAYNRALGHTWVAKCRKLRTFIDSSYRWVLLVCWMNWGNFWCTNVNVTFDPFSFYTNLDGTTLWPWGKNGFSWDFWAARW